MISQTMVNLKLKPAFDILPNVEMAKIKTETLSDDVIDYINPHPDVIFNTVRNRISGLIYEFLKKMLATKENIKIGIRLNIMMYSLKPDESDPRWTNYVQRNHHIMGKTQIINMSNLKSVIEENLDNIEHRIDSIVSSDSSMKIKQFLSFDITSWRIYQERGASYIPTPVKYNNARCGLINIKKRR